MLSVSPHFYLKDIELCNFRCYETKKYQFSPYINVFVGKNATGKTSLAEAIGYLGVLKSFKGTKDKDVLNTNAEFFFLNGNYEEKTGKQHNVIMSFDGKNKNVKKNNVEFKRLSDYIGFSNIVCFTPEDIELIKGAPSLKRSFLDLTISQIDKEYLNSLTNYKRILKARNEFLKKFENQDIDLIYLETLTESLIKESKVIIKKRNEFLKNIEPYVTEIMNKLTSDNEIIEFLYEPKTKIEMLEKDFEKRINHDRFLCTTTAGPHRDDVKVYINKQDAALFCSQGQQRTAVIALKIGVSNYLKQINANQIIILDDVLSELDKQRQKNLLDSLNLDSQLFITTTSIDHIDSEIMKNANIITFEKGDS